MYFGERILIVAAHPDDEILGMGGTIPLLKDNGALVDVVIVTDGSSTQYIGDKEVMERKHSESVKALEILRVDSVFQWKFPDMLLDTIPHVNLNQVLEDLINKNKYDCVFCQDFGDINMDHKKVYESVSVAVRPHPFQHVKLFLTYYVNSSSEWGGISNKIIFSPNVFVDITNTLELKLEAMAEYKSELRDYPHPRSLKAIENSAKYFGNMVGYDCAEAFKLIFSR